jgi:hypothetical protein
MIVFHRFLNATAIAFSGTFAIWARLVFLQDGTGPYQFLAAGFGVAPLALRYYLANLRRCLGR